MSSSRISPEFVAHVRLALVDGVGPLLRQQLLEQFGSPVDVFNADPDALQSVPGIGPKLAHRIVAAIREIDAEAEIDQAHALGVDVLTEDDQADYPRLLREIPDPPGVLFRRGQQVAGDELAMAIVGTRHASRYGLQQAERLAGGLARAGMTVVSGLARGIDAAAHQAALAAGGRTIAVLAGGVHNIYPPEHCELADSIAEQGFLLSEAPPQRPPLAGTFPRRNRIISGLSLGTIVVEAAKRSGALITARHAYEQGREAFAVPGPVDSRGSQGTHALIRDGATLVETVDDVFAQLGPLVEGVCRDAGPIVRHPAELQLNAVEQQVLQAIETTPTSVDTITRLSALPVHRVLSTITVLEMRHLVQRVGGNQVARV